MSSLRQYLALLYARFKSRLTQIRDTPHAIAGGVAIGILFGFSPFFGLKTLLAILVAWLCRCSKLSAVLAVALHDVLLPLGPFILRWQFQIGYFLISHPHRFPDKLPHKHLHIDYSLSWRDLSSKTLHILWPTFIGSLIVGVPIAIVMYCVVLEIVKRAHARRAAQG